MNISQYFSYALVALSAAFFSSFASAGYLDFSTHWKAPAEEQGTSISKRSATNIVSSCRTVQNYINKSGNNSGAVVVAGPHTTQTDHNKHLTVRLYNNGNHEKSCHVYMKNNDYSSCSCLWN